MLRVPWTTNKWEGKQVSTNPTKGCLERLEPDTNLCGIGKRLIRGKSKQTLKDTKICAEVTAIWRICNGTGETGLGEVLDERGSSSVRISAYKNQSRVSHSVRMRENSAEEYPKQSSLERSF